MSIKLAGTELVHPDEGLCAWIEANLPVGDAFPWAVDNWPGPDLGARVEAPAADMPKVLRVSELWWPATSARRWAFGAFLADRTMADAVRQAAHGDGTADDAVALELDDGRGLEVVEAQVNVLRVVPLSAAAKLDDDDPFEPNNLYLLVVVDARYYWARTPCPDLGIGAYGAYNSSAGGTGGTAPSWADVIGMVADALGIELDLPDVPDAYLSPDPAFNLAGAPAPVVLDALLANVGMRLVANLDGSFAVHDFEAAKQAREDDDSSDAGQARDLVAGGDGFADDL